MDARDNDHHNDNNMQAEDTTPAQPVALAEIEMQDLDDSTVESSTSTPFNASTTSLASSLSERIGLRRTRVEDDHDDERDRRHPSERVGSPLNSPPSLQSPSSLSALHAAESASTSSTSGPASFSGQLPGSSNSAAPASPGPFRFFQHMPSFSHNHNTASPSHPSSPHVHLPPPQHNTTPSTDSAAPSSNGTSTNSDAAATRPPRLNIVHQYLGGFAVSFDVNGVRTTVPLSGPAPPPNAPRANSDANSMATDPSNNGPAGENPVPEQSQSESQTQPRAQPQPQQQRRFPGDGGQSLPTNNTLADLLRHLSILTALSMGGAGLFDRDMEDPERAKKLVDGLEDVPVGLVKRLERVGKASENSEDGSEADGTGLGDGGCAICWDRLLTKEKVDEGQAIDDDESTGTEPTAASSDSHPLPPTDPTTEEAEEATVDANETSPGNYKRVVSLPCAHVFHAQCLNPWFSKPKQTTCPICRFNIDPENLTYTSGAQRRAAARREREQERARARAEGRDDSEGGDEEGEDANGGDGPGIGIDIPMFGGTPIIVPLGGGRRRGQQPGDAPPANAQDQPTADGADVDAPAEDDTPHAGHHAHDHRLQDIVTIGVDMYIGRGPPPPFAMGGDANVFQFPIPGGAHGPPMNAAPGNPPSTNTNHNPDVDAAHPPQHPTAGEADAQASDRGNGGGRRGTAFAIPLGQGFGRILGDAFSRIFAGGHAHEHGNREPQAPAANGGTNDNTGPGDQHEGPAMFGPERPPAPVRGAVPTMPGGVGIGVGGGRGPGPFSFSFPVGGGGGGAPGGDVPQNGGQQGAGGGPRIFETMIPLLDILFGPRTPTTQTQGEAQPSQQPVHQHAPQTAPQPVQPQPQHPQPAPHERGNLPHTGFGWTFISGPPGAPPTFMSGSPIPRPASAPVPGRQRQQEPRKLWVLPSAPGLTLRQRVEKKEQEAGLRCCDVLCGVGPSDEDPLVDVGLEEMRQLKIRKFEGVSALDSGLVIGEEEHDEAYHHDHQHQHKQHQRCDAVCDHTFHSSCLVSAERVASRGVSPAFLGSEGREEVEVSCPVCRGVGRVSRDDWENGVRALG